MSKNVMQDGDARRRQLARIHLGAKALDLDRSTYEDMLWAVARERSSKYLDYAGRQRVLEHLDSCGAFAKQKSRGSKEWAWVDSVAPDKQPMLKKIIMQLKSAERGKSYADGIAKRMFAVERLEFCAPDQLHKIVSALTFDARRHA